MKECLRITKGKFKGKTFEEFEQVKFPIAVRGSKEAGYMVDDNKFIPRGKYKLVKC